MTPPGLQDRFRGCMLGHALGDALGAPFENLGHDLVLRLCPDPLDMLRQPPANELVYTDDTEMAIAVAVALLDRGHADEERLATSFAAHYDPTRGYGRGARVLLELMQSGGDWRTVRMELFPGGSFGNGAAMRVHPVALAFVHDTDTLLEQADASALPTHVHDLGRQGAQLLALALSLAMRGGMLDRGAFFDELLGHAWHAEYRTRLEGAADREPGDALRDLGTGIAAHESVVTAIACFASRPESFLHVIARAIELGGDVDTIAAMAGGLSGAHLGVAGLPSHLLDALEDGDRGRTHIDDLARLLFERFAT